MTSLKKAAIIAGTLGITIFLLVICACSEDVGSDKLEGEWVYVDSPNFMYVEFKDGYWTGYKDGTKLWSYPYELDESIGEFRISDGNSRTIVGRVEFINNDEVILYYDTEEDHLIRK